MRKELIELMRVTRQYIAPGIKEVDDALNAATDAIIFSNNLRERLGLHPSHFNIKEEGLNPRGPRFL